MIFYYKHKHKHSKIFIYIPYLAVNKEEKKINFQHFYTNIKIAEKKKKLLFTVYFQIPAKQ